MGDVQIAPYCVDEMVAALAVGATVPTLDYDGQCFVGQLYSNASWNRAAMQAIEHIGA